MTLRASQREATLETIRDAALEELREEGSRGLSLRSIARRAGLSPAGLYRYFEGRDGILTELITVSLYGLAAAITAAADTEEDPAEATFRGFMAYRDWAVAHPARFNLCFGEPLPGYSAPAGGATVVAFRAAFQPLLEQLGRAGAAGRLRVPDLPDELEGLAAVAEEMVPGAPAGLAALAFETWARVHGITSLEVNGHFAYLGFDTRPMAALQIRRMVEHIVQ